MHRSDYLIKICGLNDRENIRAVLQLNPEMIGLIFYKPSPRCIQDDFEFPKVSHVSKLVGVFVDEDPSKVIDTALKFQLDYVQLHGNESAEVCLKLRDQGLGVIKAFQVGDRLPDTSLLSAYSKCTDYFLMDTRSPQYGGSGIQFDWSILADYQGSVPLILSGGIGPQDISAIHAIDFPNIKGIDLNSKFEITPGIKDISKLKSFFSQINQYDHANI